MLLLTPVWSLEKLCTHTCYGCFTWSRGKSRDKIWIVIGLECVDDVGKSDIIVWAIYGLKSACALFNKQLAQFMHELGYKSCDADPDLWMNPEFRPEIKEFVIFMLCRWHPLHPSYPDDVLNKLNGYVTSILTWSLSTCNYLIASRLHQWVHLSMSKKQ